VEVNENIRSSCAVTLNKFFHHSISTLPSPSPLSGENRALSSLRKKVKDNDLIITKADKGNCVVVLNKGQYVDKVLDFLDSGSFKILNSSPLEKFLVKFNSTINKTLTALSPLGFSKFKLTPINPAIPKLYGLPKIHKANVPIRPVVSFCNSPCHRLSSWLNDTILEITNFRSHYSIKNSTELCLQLKNLSIPTSAIMVSFDVSNLFPSIPPLDCISLVRRLLSDCVDLDSSQVGDLVTLVSLVLEQNFFQFNGNYYSQTAGLAMGSCLSPLLAEVFMSSIEQSR